MAYVCLSFRRSSLPLTLDRPGSDCARKDAQVLKIKTVLCRKETLNVCCDGKRKLQEVQGSWWHTFASFTLDLA